jgi:hypothetical protein
MPTRRCRPGRGIVGDAARGLSDGSEASSSARSSSGGDVQRPEQAHGHALLIVASEREEQVL